MIHFYLSLFTICQFVEFINLENDIKNATDYKYITYLFTCGKKII